MQKKKKKDGGTRYKGHRKDGRRGKGMHSFDIKTKIYYGDGALDRLTQIPYKKVMIITDPFVVQSGMVMMITSRLDEAKIEFEVFKDVVPDPPIDKVVAGVKAVMDYKPEAIVAVGGGSAIDSAKAIREFASRVGGLDNIALIAVPTTSGTGSEVTSFSVISDPQEQRKYPLVSESLLPTEAILDAELTRSVIREWTFSPMRWKLMSARRAQSSPQHFPRKPLRSAEPSFFVLTWMETIPMRERRCTLHPVWQAFPSTLLLLELTTAWLTS